ncbi:MAG: Gfo/Idh/MocA family oxidoreductase [Actinomycetota bacterium]|nr:Gfo/Idh/MocA family oxidoreductase [Actinomycetota bacterium]
MTPAPDGRRLRVGVIGLGHWGPNLVRNFADNPRSEIAWLCDKDHRALSTAAARYPAARATFELDDLLADPDLDAVVVATPISTHHAIAAAALDAGKHVWVEKPLAVTSEEVADLIERAERGGLVLLPGHIALYSPSVVRIKELIDAGELGDIHFISISRVNLGLHQSDASVVWDLAPHDLSILRYWLDDLPTEVSAMARGCIFPDIPDVAFVNMRFESGTIAHLELSWLSPSKLRRTAIIGSAKMVVYDDTSTEPVRIFDSGASLPDFESFGEFQLAYRTGDILSPRIDASEPLALEVADFCAAVLDGTPPRSSLAIGVDVVRSIEAVEESLATGGGAVSLDSAGQPSSSATD